MSVNCDSTSNYCKSYCQVERRNQFAGNEITVVDGADDGCAVSTSYTDEYGFVSNNDLICPVNHFYTADEVVGDAISLNNYSSSDGSFSLGISKDNFPPEANNERYVTISTCVAGKSSNDG